MNKEELLKELDRAIEINDFALVKKINQQIKEGGAQRVNRFIDDGTLHKDESVKKNPKLGVNVNRSGVPRTNMVDVECVSCRKKMRVADILIPESGKFKCNKCIAGR